MVLKRDTIIMGAIVAALGVLTLVTAFVKL